jgi:hypothetical protein
VYSYLEDVYSQHPLLPQDPKQRALNVQVLLLLLLWEDLKSESLRSDLSCGARITRLLPCEERLGLLMVGISDSWWHMREETVAAELKVVRPPPPRWVVDYRRWWWRRPLSSLGLGVIWGRWRRLPPTTNLAIEDFWRAAEDRRRPPPQLGAVGGWWAVPEERHSGEVLRAEVIDIRRRRDIDKGRPVRLSA